MCLPGTLAYVVAGASFYGGAAVKIVYMHTSYVALGGVTIKSKTVLRAVRPAITENLFGGTPISSKVRMLSMLL